jgi:hypothetical protein
MKSIVTLVLAVALAGVFSMPARAFGKDEGKVVGKEVKDGKDQEKKSKTKPPKDSPHDHDRGQGNDDKAQHDNGKGNDDKPGR